MRFIKFELINNIIIENKTKYITIYKYFKDHFLNIYIF